MQIIEKLLQNLKNAAAYNPDVQEPYECILWTDKEKQWDSVIPRLQHELPQLYILGKYSPKAKQGPAIWLRCVIAGKIDIEEDESLGIKEESGKYRIAEDIPIIYLPGVSRQDLRAIENCPDELKPLAPLQYSGIIWSQYNAKDWTILAFLKSEQGGLGLNVASDTETKDALKIAISTLLDEEIELLNHKHLDKDYFNKLIAGGDPVKDVLNWINDEKKFKENLDKNKWKAFVKLCQSNLGFNPEKEGIIKAAEQLAIGNGEWKQVWDRFCEAPKRYLNIPEQIEKCEMPPVDLFSNAESHGRWPQWNSDEEEKLKEKLQLALKLPEQKLKERIIELDKEHGPRRKTIWNELGKTQLTDILKHLKTLSIATSSHIKSGSTDDVIKTYGEKGWKTDSAVIKALTCISSYEDYKLISALIKTMYLPWLESSANYLQSLDYPSESINNQILNKTVEGECYLFIDGLRLDTAKQLQFMLANKGYDVEELLKWAALPTVTATGKPASTPVKDKISGIYNSDFEPCIKETEKQLNSYHLKKLLTENGWKMLNKNDFGDGKGNAWFEIGDIDHEGHDRGWKLAHSCLRILNEIIEFIDSITAAGWKIIRIVTDHGWLLVPGGLPKVDLPSFLTETKWGRCAFIKEGSVCDEKQYPWYWNKSVHVAIPPGVCCYKNGVEYTHGGISLQECIIADLVIKNQETFSSSRVKVTDVKWKGLRCSIVADGDVKGLKADIRTQAGDIESSVIVAVKEFREEGLVSVIVEDEDFEGKTAFIVIIDSSGELIYQKEIIIAE